MNLSSTVRSPASPLDQARALLAKFTEDRLLLRLWQSGRELFHSNMFAYLLGYGGKRADRLLTLLGVKCSSETHHCIVLREYRHIDAFVLLLPKVPSGATPDGNSYWEQLHESPTLRGKIQIVVVENKFKSLPDDAQLIRYSIIPFEGVCKDRSCAWLQDRWLEQGDSDAESARPRTRFPINVAFVLLAPGEAATRNLAVTLEHRPKGKPAQTRALNAEWKGVDWDGVAQILLDGGTTEATLEEQFLSAYGRQLRTACALHKEIRDAFKVVEFKQLHELAATANPFGLHDFVDKLRFSCLTGEVVTALEREGLAQAGLLIKGCRVRAWKAGDWYIMTETFMTRATGGCDITAFSMSYPQASLGIQLQSGTLKLMVSMEGEKPKEAQQVLDWAAKVLGLPRVDGDTPRKYTQDIAMVKCCSSPVELTLRMVPGVRWYHPFPLYEQKRRTDSLRWTGLSGRDIAENMLALVLNLVKEGSQQKMPAESKAGTVPHPPSRDNLPAWPSLP
jgi:hypothetical protein